MFLVIGIMVSIGVEIFVNVGSNLRLLPVTGVTLPFVSYGGSSILASFILIGMIENIIIKSKI